MATRFPPEFNNAVPMKTVNAIKSSSTKAIRNLAGPETLNLMVFPLLNGSPWLAERLMSQNTIGSPTIERGISIPTETHSILTAGSPFAGEGARATHDNLI